LSQNEIKSVLESYRTIAIVGLSRNSAKASYQVAKYMNSVGYHIIPVNPFADEILGEKCYKSLLEVPKTIDIVNVFRPSEELPSIVNEAIIIKNIVGSPMVIWMQLGIINENAARQAKEAGFTVIMDRCMMIEHRRLSMKSIGDS